MAGGHAGSRTSLAIEHRHFAKGPAAAQGSDGQGLAVVVALLHSYLAAVDDAHEAAGIAS